MKRRIGGILPSVVLIPVFLLTSCGQDDDPTNPDTLPSSSRIAFLGGVEETSGGTRREVFTVDVNGENLYQVTHTTSEEWIQTMDASPTAAKIAYGLWRGGVWVVNADGSNPILVANIDDVFDVQWSPDGSRILFDGGTSSSTIGYYVVDADGSGGLRYQVGSGFVETCWARDGKRIALSSDNQNIERPDLLVTLDTRTSVLDTLVTLDSDPINSIAWGGPSDRLLIAFRARSAPATIASVDPISAMIDTLLVLPGLIPSWSALDWSANGERFLFVSSGDGIYSAKPDGSDWRRVVSVAAQGDARWSPDGSRITFTSGTDTEQIHVVSSDGSDHNVLTSNLFSASDGRWVVD